MPFRTEHTRARLAEICRQWGAEDSEAQELPEDRAGPREMHLDISATTDISLPGQESQPVHNGDRSPAGRQEAHDEFKASLVYGAQLCLKTPKHQGGAVSALKSMYSHEDQFVSQHSVVALSTACSSMAPVELTPFSGPHRQDLHLCAHTHTERHMVKMKTKTEKEAKPKFQPTGGPQA